MPKNPLTPRQTAMRLLEHMEEEASYGDIIRQVRILQDIDQTMSDAAFVGSESEQSVEQARKIARGGRAPGIAQREKPRATTHGSWKSLDSRSDDKLDSVLRRAVWIH